VQDGRCECVLPTNQPDEKFFLILGSLSSGSGPFRVQVHTDVAIGPASMPLARQPEDAAWTARVHGLSDRLAMARRSRSWKEDYAPVSEPPRQRDFFLFAKEHDFHNPDNYITIAGELQGVGRHCQVYVDRDCTNRASLQPTVDDIV